MELPDDPCRLSYLVGALLQVPAVQRQELLESSTTGDRLRMEAELLTRELHRQSAIGTRKGVARPFRPGPKDISLN